MNQLAQEHQLSKQTPKLCKSFRLQRLDKVLDCNHGGVSKHLGQIADAMYEWEGPIAEQLQLTRVDIAAIKTEHPNKLRLQT